jgi:hypothetical protein
VSKVVRLENFASELKEFSRANIEQRKKAVVSGVARSLPDLVAASPVDTGQYAASWMFSETEQSVILGNYAPHAPIIEKGARPFTPPIGPLLGWAKRVLQSPSQPPDYDSDVWALAKGVQKKIAAEGIKPCNVLEKTLPKILENIIMELKRGNG